MINKKNRRGQSHVEVMLSFGLFLGALTFIFIFINPFAETGEKIYSIDKIKAEVIYELSSNVGILSIISTNVEGRCKPDLDSFGTNYIIVPDEIYPGKWTVYYDDDLFDGGDNIKMNQKQECSIGSYYEEVMVTETKIENLIKRYEDDYTSLKKSMEITDDFIFDIRGLINPAESFEIKEESKRRIPAGVNVESKNYAIRVINSEGIINEYVLNIRVW